jgi:hypothetical protein
LTAVPPFPAEHHVCVACSLSYADQTAPAAIDLVKTYPARYRHCLAQLAGPLLRVRPGPQTWSALEYVCHVRDVYDVYHIRVSRALMEDDPVLAPMRNRERAKRENYNGQDPDDVLDALERNVDRFAGLADQVGADQWTRTVTRLPGERRTVLWLVRQAAHEGLHHLHDIAAPSTLP